MPMSIGNRFVSHSGLQQKKTNSGCDHTDKLQSHIRGKWGTDSRQRRRRFLCLFLCVTVCSLWASQIWNRFCLFGSFIIRLLCRKNSPDVFFYVVIIQMWDVGFGKVQLLSASASVCLSIASQILFSQRWRSPHHLRGHGGRQYRQLWQRGASAVVSPPSALCSRG